VLAWLVFLGQKFYNKILIFLLTTGLIYVIM
jgi:hypothetical protein